MSDEVKRALHEALDERDGMDRTLHGAQHEWVGRKMERERNREQRLQASWDKVRATVLGGLFLMLAAGALNGLYQVGKFILSQYEKSSPVH